MYGRETYKKLERRVPAYMQGIRLAEDRRSPQSIKNQARTERAMRPHPVLGGTTRNDRVWYPGHVTTIAPASVEGEKRPAGWFWLAAVVGVLWLAR
jgi:hypothetical protein